MILDTTFLIDFMEGLPEAMQKIETLQSENETIYVTAPSVFELWTGLAQCQRPVSEEQKIRRVVDSQLFLDLDKSSAEEAGLMNGNLSKAGMPIDPEDCMIAGIAKHYDETILTRNIKHFRRIVGVKIEEY